jgi:4-amino-4-deoxy-L-arabinose transferase-like glycosyltransferase
MQWASNASVAHYPTEVIRALDRSPFHEWIVLHVYVLTGHDRFFALIQWFMLAFSGVAVWELTKLMGGRAVACALAVVLCVTAPMAVLQATSTQNNLVAAFAFVAFLLFGLRLSREPGHHWTEAVFCGLALGLAILTQTTSLVFALGFCVWFAVMILHRHAARGWLLGGVIGLMTFALIAGYGWRNHELFGHPFGLQGEPPLRYFPDEDRTKVAIPYANDGMTPFIYFSNLFRNAVMHLATPFQNPNDSVVMIVEAAYAWAGLPLNDPRSTLYETRFFFTADRHEDFAGNLPLCVIAFAALLVYPFRWRSVTPLAGPYAACLLAAILLFAYVLRWQPFHPRVELPLFFAWAVFAAVVLPVATHRWLASALAGLSIAYAFPYWMDNYRRPLFGKKSILTTPRELQYFRDFPHWHSDYYHAVREMKKRGYRDVGLWTDGHDLHYPIWPMLRKITKGTLGFDEVAVTNVSGKLWDGKMPDAVLATHVPVLKSIMVNGVRYDEVWRGEKTLAIYEPARNEE